MVPAVAGPPSPSSERSNYVVQFRVEPLAGSATGPSPAETSAGPARPKLDVTSPAAVEHRRRIDDIELQVLRAAGVSEDRLGYRYRTTLAGFSARLTASEAQRIRQGPEVASVTADRVRVVRHRRPGHATSTTENPAAPVEAPAGATPPAATSVPVTAVPAAPAVTDPELFGHTADFLGLPTGVWAQLGGPGQAGDGIVIGVIDGGIFPEHPSFADEPIAADGSRNYIGPAYSPPPATWRGTCQEGENFPATTCNNKLIGARWFVDGWGADNVAEEDFLSPRDVDGHGTGMASAAAGNYGVDPSFQGNDLGLGVISGIAPRARLAHYKALWAIPAFEGAGFGSEADLAAAVDAAVADGVDVLSMSVGGPLGETVPITDQSTMLDPWSQALLRAFDAGVLAVLPAGNSGPGSGSVEASGHVPWVVSAGASALPTTFTATATVSGGPDGPIMVQGASPSPGLAAVPLVDAADAAAPGVSRGEALACEPGTLDPALVKGKAVLCAPLSFFDASGALYHAGAAGAVFYQPARRPTSDDFLIPTIVVTPADSTRIRQVMAASPNVTIAFSPGTLSATTTGDIVASLTGRGPAIGSESILKPDLLAPGLEIVVAHTLDVPPGARAPVRVHLAGSLPPPQWHLPGRAPCRRVRRPPPRPPSRARPERAQVGAHDHGESAHPGGLRWDPVRPGAAARPRGGPHRANRAADPGLVLNETTEQFRDYVAAQVPSRDLSHPTVDATDLNLPSIAFDPLVGPRSTRRTFTSVDAQPGTWTASFEGLAGVAATATPGEFSVDPGQSATVQFSFAPDVSAPDGHVQGAVVLTNAQDGRTVRLPVVLRPEAFEVPRQLNFGATGPDGHAAASGPDRLRGPALSAGLRARPA